MHPEPEITMMNGVDVTSLYVMELQISLQSVSNVIYCLLKSELFAVSYVCAQFLQYRCVSELLSTRKKLE